MSEQLKCFTAYDVRGRVPEELNNEIAARIGLAFCRQIEARKMVIGHDIRLSSPGISETLCQVLSRAGISIQLFDTDKRVQRRCYGAHDKQLAHRGWKASLKTVEFQ